ncbi:MAG: exodeoxyribonuclease VII small subunit [Magnetococcales bacterium]|nr:exodeoxyribonuclease VII small subunit [Magnetococcales bacterium]
MTAADQTPIAFEHALNRLEEIVQRLERGDLPLEEGLAAFEEGITLSQACQARLDEADKRIEELTASSLEDSGSEA